MPKDTWTSSPRHTVVGYFTSGDDAHRAIDELLQQGFPPSAIGAAFHSSSSAASPGIPESIAEETRYTPTTGPNAPGAGSTVSGPASNTNAVTPSGLSTGGGTEFSGAGRPGPIPGGEIPSSLPHSLPSSLNSEPAKYTATAAPQETHRQTAPNWREKLKHVFGNEGAHSHSTGHGSAAPDKTAMNFGTGEGHLSVYPDSDYACSVAAFESAFFGMGISSEHARQLSRGIRRGGAIVTVDSPNPSSNAEQILERNGGSVRHEATSAAFLGSADHAWDDAHSEERVHIFGRLQRVYPGYVSSTGSPTRRAS